MVGPRKALVIEQEVKKSLLRKVPKEFVPPPGGESEIYSWYFIVSKDGGLRPILDLCQLNHMLKTFKFKMLILKLIVTQIRSKDWFVMIDLKDVYFHISILS